MKRWNNEQELFSLMRQELYTAVVGDIMDKHGYVHQFLSPKIRPLKDNMLIAGRAMTVLEADIDQISDERLLNKTFGLMLEALDDLKENEVYICTGSTDNYALWGELMSTRAKKLGSAGSVVDGYSRDTHGVLALDFPTFSYGCYSQDQAPRGKVIDFRIPIQFGEVTVNPGDIIFGDIDGVCVIPKEIEKDIIMEALEKANGEKIVKTKLEEGMSACEAFAKYGVI
jgi:regulator of RNase E activity RraA